jgi:hypothetical protein
VNEGNGTMEANLIFPEYIKSECIKKNLSFRKLCEGVINASSIERFFDGELDLDFDKQIRLLSRLGYDHQDYEKYVYKKTFDKLRVRDKILSLIKDKNKERLFEELVKYKEKYYKESSVDKQFYLAMKLQEDRMKGKDDADLLRTAVEALIQTVPGYSEHHIDLEYLSIEETNLLIETLILNKNDSSKEKLTELRKLFESIDTREVSLNFKAKIMPKIAYHYINIYMEAIDTPMDYINLLTLCNKAIETLRSSKYMYYLYELLNFSEIINEALAINEIEVPNIIENDYDIAVLKGSLDFLAERYHKSKHTDDFCYIYDCFNYYCLGETVRARRKMLGLRLSDLSKDEAVQRAIGRLERNERKTIRDTVRKILLSLNLCTEFYKLRIVTDENNVIEDYISCVRLINGKQYSKAYDMLKKLEIELDLSVLVNRTELMWKKLCILRGLGEISNADYANKLKALLLELIPGIDLECVSNKDYYFSIQELTMIYNIARFGETKDKIIDFIYNYIRTEDSIFRSREELWFLNAIADMYGDCEKYEKSLELSEFVLESAFDMKSASFIQESLYGIFWSDARYKHLIDKKSQTMILRACYELSVFCMDDYSISFYKRKLDEL